MYQMLNEIDDGVLLVRRGNFMTQTIRYMRPYLDGALSVNLLFKDCGECAGC